jgi:hypothetical protein
MYEPGIIVGKDEESNKKLEIAQQLLDCNGERLTQIHTQSNGWGDQHTIPPNIQEQIESPQVGIQGTR